MLADYGGRKQRWVIVENRETKHKERATPKKNLEREEAVIAKACQKLTRKVFVQKEELREVIESQRKQHPLFIFNHQILGVFKKFPNSKRKIKVGYKILYRFSKNETRIEKLRQRKGKFILATDCLDDGGITAEEIIGAYRNRNRGIEGCFKFLKRRDLNLNQIFLKKESRIESMMIIMTFILFVNNLGHKKLREFLASEDLAIPNQMGRSTKNRLSAGSLTG